MAAKTLHIIVKGKVQGVSYRESTRRKALDLGLTGTVQNLQNGDVEIYVTGDDVTLAQLVVWCREGPQQALVSDLQSSEVSLVEFTDFVIKRR